MPLALEYWATYRPRSPAKTSILRSPKTARLQHVFPMRVLLRPLGQVACSRTSIARWSRQLEAYHGPGAEQRCDRGVTRKSIARPRKRWEGAHHRGFQTPCYVAPLAETGFSRRFRRLQSEPRLDRLAHQEFLDL